jgi:hypothetical protein
MNKLVHINYLKLVSAITFLLLSTSLNAATLVEDFNDGSPAWESRWLGKNSNIENYSGVGSPTGALFLYFTDGDELKGAADPAVDITFDSIFGASIRDFSMDIDTSSVSTKIQVYDGLGSIILDSFSDTAAGFETISLSSMNGISGFSLSSTQLQQIEGNAALDNVVVSTIPVPAAAWLFVSGLIGLIGVARRKRQA